MGFVIAFPAGTTKRRSNTNTKSSATAEITIFPGVRYERYTPEAPRHTKPKPPRRFFDSLPQPG